MPLNKSFSLAFLFLVTLAVAATFGIQILSPTYGKFWCAIMFGLFITRSCDRFLPALFASAIVGVVATLSIEQINQIVQSKIDKNEFWDNLLGGVVMGSIGGAIAILLTKICPRKRNRNN